MLRLLVICCFFGTGSPLLAQADAALSSFSATVHDASVILSWTINAGNTCNGIRIERSTDGLSYEEIGSIAGVCGSTDQSISYTFQDDRPALNQSNHYRLELGSLGYTSARQVEVLDFSANKIQVRPNPSSTSFQISIDNPRSQELIGSLHDRLGNLKSEFTTRESSLQIDATLLPVGVYLLSLVNEDGLTLNSKLVVYR
ncbi:MAG: T9SS type A sorting domain-containing protein [Cryomorphaceae bacterium]